MIYDAHHSNMINAANQNTAVISQKYQVNQAALRAKNPQKNKGIPYLDVRKFTQNYIVCRQPAVLKNVHEAFVLHYSQQVPEL